MGRPMLKPTMDRRLLMQADNPGLAKPVVLELEGFLASEHETEFGIAMTTNACFAERKCLESLGRISPRLTTHGPSPCRTLNPIS